jgi:DNA-binding transcriptional LysR family regulator
VRSAADELDLREVRAFVAVVDSGSFLAAAARLGLSQPAISLQVRRMEAQLGTALLVRDRGGCRPTAAGARLLPHARRLLEAGDRARHALDRERLSLGASTNIGVYHLPGVLAGWDEPEMVARIDLRIAPHAPLLEALSDGGIDVALTEWWDGRAGYDARPWHREPVVAIVPPAHPLAGASSVSIERLLAEPLVGGEPGTGTATLLRETFGERVALPPPRHVFGSTEGVKRAVAAGLGVSLVLASSCRDEAERGTLRVLRLREGTPAKTFHAVTRADAPRDGIAATLRDRLARGGARLAVSPRAGSRRRAGIAVPQAAAGRRRPA